MKHNVLYKGFGFPVLLKGVEYKGEGPDRYLDIPHEELASRLLEALLVKPAPWTGAEMRFVRKELDMTQAEFAKLIHVKNHSTVVGWEKKDLHPTGISEPAEVFIRLQVACVVHGQDRATELFSRLRETELQDSLEGPFEIEVDRAA